MNCLVSAGLVSHHLVNKRESVLENEGLLFASFLALSLLPQPDICIDDIVGDLFRDDWPLLPGLCNILSHLIGAQRFKVHLRSFIFHMHMGNMSSKFLVIVSARRIQNQVQDIKT